MGDSDMDDGAFFVLFPNAASAFFGAVGIAFILVGAHMAWAGLKQED